jgi:hypothetical protein
MPIKFKTIHKRLLTILILTLTLFMLGIFEEHPAAVEKYYSQGLYIFICSVLHPVFNIIPFSVGDLVYIAIVAYLIYLLVNLVVLLFKKQFRQIVNLSLGIVIGVQAGTLIF